MLTFRPPERLNNNYLLGLELKRLRVECQRLMLDGNPELAERTGKALMFLAERSQQSFSIEGKITISNKENREKLCPSEREVIDRKLVAAAKQGDSEEVLHLLLSGADPNFGSSGSTCAAKFAIKNNDEKTLYWLSVAGLDANTVDSSGMNLGHYAALEGDAGCLSVLLYQTNLDLESWSNESRNMGHYAARRGNAEALQVLLGYGMDPNTLTGDRQTMAHLAARFGHLGCLEALASSRRWDVNAIGGWTGRSSGHEAVDGGHSKCLAFLLSKGLDPDIKDNEGHSAAFDAIICKNASCLRVLADRSLEKKLDLTWRGSGNQTYAHLAASRGAVECLEVLLTADPDLINAIADGGVSVGISAARNKHAGALRVLRLTGSWNVDWWDESGRKAAHYCADHKNCLQECVDAGITLDPQLESACQKHDVSFVQKEESGSFTFGRLFGFFKKK